MKDAKRNRKITLVSDITMEVLTINEEDVDDSILKKISEVLTSGGVIAHASDTCYGLLADVFNEAAVNKVSDIKSSAEDKPMSIFVSSVSQVQEFAEITPESEEFMHQNLPGPFTVILSKRDHFHYQPQNRTIGIRVPNNSFVRKLVDYYGGPLTTTSANITGNPSLYSGVKVQEEFSTQTLQPNLIVDFGEIPLNKPSRIIDFSRGEPRWLR
jgi:L-threonylcarbamoyladenylate synthase